MRHRIAILLGAAIFIGLFLVSWLVVSGPLTHMFHSRVESSAAMLTIMLVCVAIIAGVIVGAWDASQEVPRTHHHISFHALFHH